MLACSGMLRAPKLRFAACKVRSEGPQLHSQQLGCAGSTLEEVLLHLPKVISWGLAVGKEEGFFLSDVGESVLSVMDSHCDRL